MNASPQIFNLPDSPKNSASPALPSPGRPQNPPAPRDRKFPSFQSPISFQLFFPPDLSGLNRTKPDPTGPIKAQIFFQLQGTMAEERNPKTPLINPGCTIFAQSAKTPPPMRNRSLEFGPSDVLGIWSFEVVRLGRGGTSHGTGASCKILNVYRPWYDGTAPAHRMHPPQLPHFAAPHCSRWHLVDPALSLPIFIPHPTRHSVGIWSFSTLPPTSVNQQHAFA